jgi:hypothetical protein
MHTKLERFARGLILAPLAPLAGFLVFWWAAFSRLPESWIPFAAIAGLLVGILADILLLKKLLDHRLGLLLWGMVFLFYSIGAFGFFMGVPAFNVALAIPAGYVIGSRLAAENADKLRLRKAALCTAWFTSGVLALICAASAFIALTSSSTASDLQGMLGLGFEVTQTMIVALILVGGVMLLALDWGLSVASVRGAYWFFHRKV